MTMAFVLDLDA